MRTFNAIVFTGDKANGNQGFVKYRKISQANKFINFIEKKFPAWTFINFYDRKTNEKTTLKKNRVPTIQPTPGSDKLFLSDSKIK